MPVIINGTTGISGTDGSAGTPALQGTDANTGLFFPAADQIAFAEGGVETMRLDASGNVGIGTTTPGAKLDVVGNVRVSGNSQLQIFNGAGTGGVSIQTDNASSPAMTFNTGGSERMRINTSGNVGIGTSSPTRPLTVNTAGNYNLFFSTTGDTGLSLAANNRVQGTSDFILVQQSGGDGYVWNRANSSLLFGTNNAERMRITGDGNVCIGASNPFHRLDIVGNNARVMFNVSTGSPAAIQFCVNPANNAYATQIFDADFHAFRTFGTNRFFVGTNRVECIGTGARGATGAVLTTNDSLGALFRNAGYIEFSSDIGQIGLNYFVSDENKKENIQPSTFSSSALIANIRFISFDWKPDTGQSGHVDVGVSAQQLRSLDGRLTSELADGSLMVNEPALVSHLGKALQEALAKIDALEARIAALEAR